MSPSCRFFLSLVLLAAVMLVTTDSRWTFKKVVYCPTAHGQTVSRRTSRSLLSPYTGGWKRGPSAWGPMMAAVQALMTGRASDDDVCRLIQAAVTATRCRKFMLEGGNSWYMMSRCRSIRLLAQILAGKLVNYHCDIDSCQEPTTTTSTTTPPTTTSTTSTTTTTTTPTPTTSSATTTTTTASTTTTADESEETDGLTCNGPGRRCIPKGDTCSASEAAADAFKCASPAELCCLSIRG